ncbi:MAG: hypothetical protein GY719_28315 [bacterium]|nr:hypothetical protein [bacterium]
MAETDLSQSDTVISARRAQRALLQTADELRRIDRRLAEVAGAIAPQPGRALPGELRGGAQCVRTDLLRDAIDTLSTLGRANEQDVARRRFEIDAAAGRVAAFG